MIEYKPYIHHGKELEEAILGACMLEKLAFGRIYGILEPDHFYHDGHALVFTAMKEMFEVNSPIDILTVTEWIVAKKGVEKINEFGGDNIQYYVTRLTNSVVSTAHLEYHSLLVKEMWQRRKILEIKYKGLESDLDPQKNVYDINAELNKILGNSVKKDWYDMTELMIKLYQHQEDVKKRGGIGLRTGIATIDKENGGLFEDQMIIIGARPSVGKSALAGTMAMSIAGTGKHVGIISLEMSNVEIAARLAAIDTETDYNVLFRGLYRDERQTHEVYNRIAKSTSQLPIFVTDKTDVNVLEIKAKAQKLKASNGLDCLIIDYLQLINVPETHNKNREQEIAKISRAAKIMAKEMKIPVILLCQLNREVTKRKGNDRYPQLSDLRESGSLEQDADVVMFLHSDWMAGIPVDENGNTTEGKADLVIRKWRNGKSNFIVPLDFDAPKMKFTERRGFIKADMPRDYTESQKDEDPF
jgi:replicative DNA helicase